VTGDGTVGGVGGPDGKMPASPPDRDDAGGGRPVPVERAHEHPAFELGGNTITSLASPSRGADEAALYRVEVPADGALPAHHHDHLDVFAVETGSGTLYVDGDAFEVVAGDSVVVPIGAVHHLEAGERGVTIVVTMLAGTKLVRADDGTELVPPWVS
jgi:quercetin dioxygenase-like cupin family protein